jgi:Cu+-exporting ATPase
MNKSTITAAQLKCYHCGEDCATHKIRFQDKNFCCEGCRMVYQIINKNDLCEYYNLNENPGINQRITIRKDKFAFLDDENIQSKLISFKDDTQLRATFYLPQMHCSSCLYLLENLRKLDAGIVSGKVNFTRKELDIILIPTKSSLRKCAELLTGIGYEPYISLNDLKEKRPAMDRSIIYQLGVAGFCFGNIMLMSFPEYFGIDASDEGLRSIFRWANMFLALPVLLYSALPFYLSSWKSLKHKFLNIDTPIALAIIITFIRSAYQVLSGTGSGYFDSMTGIVFFMLAGRILQDKTYRQLSFERDYTSYFPLAISILKNKEEIPTALPEIKTGDTMLIHHEELIPADGILSKGKAFIDYSFVTGESLPVLKEVGEIVYAGGKQTEGNIEVLVVKEVAQSYLTKLWDQHEQKNQVQKKDISFVDLLNRYFTCIVLTIATVTAIYWFTHDKGHLWPAVTSIFIIACPCALLLSNTFTNGNILRILGRNHFYLRSPSIIEDVANIDHIVFDKTGTLTETQEQEVNFEGNPLSELQWMHVSAIVKCSTHPLSKTLSKYLGKTELEVEHFKETTGQGIEAYISDSFIRIGSASFVGAEKNNDAATRVFIKIDNKILGSFRFSNHYRSSVYPLIKDLRHRYQLSVISGDNSSEKNNLRKILGEPPAILFNQKPEDKLQYIKHLQQNGKKVMMIGDGLNDAGALRQSNVGIAVAEQSSNFTPACDAIIEAKQLYRLHKFFSICRANKNIIVSSFVLSIVYNIAGLFFAVQGNLSPMIAAILMPSSSLSILLITFGSSTLLAKWMKLT